MSTPACFFFLQHISTPARAGFPRPLVLRTIHPPPPGFFSGCFCLHGLVPFPACFFFVFFFSSFGSFSRFFSLSSSLVPFQGFFRPLRGSCLVFSSCRLALFSFQPFFCPSVPVCVLLPVVWPGSTPAFLCPSVPSQGFFCCPAWFLLQPKSPSLCLCLWVWVLSLGFFSVVEPGSRPSFFHLHHGFPCTTV